MTAHNTAEAAQYMHKLLAEHHNRPDALRRAAVRSGVKGDEAIAAFVAADPAVVALEARAPISKSSAIDGATS